MLGIELQAATELALCVGETAEEELGHPARREGADVVRIAFAKHVQHVVPPLHARQEARVLVRVDVFGRHRRQPTMPVPMIDPAVIAALETAVAAAPDNAVLRKHLIQLLLDAERFADAIPHAAQLIARTPDDAEALQLLTRATKGKKEESTEPERKADVVPLRIVRGGEGGSFAGEVEQSTVTLKDVAGMESVKRRLDLAFLAPMRNPEMRRMYGKQLRGGLLLYGPPGCGKTFVARAVAGELGARFINIGLSDVLNMWLGESERNVHDIFENARANAPCVLFFDELDALGRKRSLMRNSSERNVVNQLLAELDSVGADNEGVFVLAATNHPWDVDSALRRPGRLDRTLLVLPPDLEARKAILESALDGRPAEGIDIDSLAKMTDLYSGADLVHLAEAATELAMEDSLQSGKARPIGMDDFRRALRDVKPSTRAWFSTARNYAEFANEGGMFDDLVEYLRKNKIR